MRLSKQILILVLLTTLSLSLYSAGTSVKVLTSKDFQQVYKGVWLVEFFAPWCGHCQQLAPEYEKAAKALNGIANIAAIDASNERVNIQIKGYPTIKLFIDGKISQYSGQRTANGIIDFIISQYKKIAYDRIGAKASSKNSGSSSGDDKDVIVLQDSNFDDLVLGDNKNAWFVEFYAPWCGHCQRLAPEWSSLATTLKGQIKVAKIDATVNKQLATRFGVNGYPSIKFFPAGKKDDSSAVDYNGPRSESGMAQWARQQISESGTFEIMKLDSQETYDEICKGRNVCVVSFLPNILDSSEQDRSRYIEEIKEVALMLRSKPFKFLWSQGGDHFEVEQKLGTVGVGYPVVVAIHQLKGVYGKMMKAFNKENFEEYLNALLSNKGRFSKLPVLPKFKTIKTEGCAVDSCTGPSSEEGFDTEL